jgi:hypothetical protein
VLLPAARRPSRDVEFDGNKAQMSMTSTGIGATMFAAGVARLPAAAVADASGSPEIARPLPRRAGGAISALRSQSIGRAQAGLAGQPVLLAEALEATGRLADGRNSRLAARFFIVDDRFFQVVALGAEGEIPPDALDTFFTSFRLIR